MNFKLGELFCGPGGIAVGARDAAFEYKGNKFSFSHEWANDYDKDTCETYAKNICPENIGSVICEDVRKLDIEKLSNIDGFAFGFPCNDFSIVGEQKGLNGNFGALYTYGIRVLKRFQPKFFVAENVGGLRNNNEGNAFQTIIDELIEQGYEVVANLYKFENYELPQARHRIIIVGIRNDLNLTFKIPVIKNPKIVTSLEAIEYPPIPINAPNNEFTRQSEKVIERLKYIKPGENVFNAKLP